MLIDGTLLWTIIVYVIIIIVVACIAVSAADEFDEDRAGWIVFGVCMAIFVGAFNGIVFWASSGVNNQTVTTTASTSQYITEPLGLTPLETYPLELGSRVGSYSETHLDVSTGRYNGHVSIDAVSGSTVTVSFQYENRTSTLEVPISKVNFYQSNDGSPSVKFYFLGLPQLQSTTVQTYEPCHFQMVNLVMACERGALITSDTTVAQLDADTIRRGLAPMVIQYVDTVDITLTTDMYDQLIGKIE